MTTRDRTTAPLDTVAVRGGQPRRHAYDAVTMPIVCAATYGFDGTDEIHAHFRGDIDREEYGRYGNPTVRAAERTLAALEGAEESVLFPTGMAAITTLLLSVLRPGDHVLATSDCYRRTRQFIRTTLAKFGVEHTFVPPGDYDAMEAALRPDRTRLILSEAPTNPYLRIVDVERVRSIAERARRAKVVIDATLATPVNLRPLALGADLVVHSGTKYLAGHNDVLSGALSGGAGMIDALRDARGTFGGMPDPHGAYLLLRGMKTLPVRMRQHNASALRVAHFLAEHDKIEAVFHPGLASHPDHAVARRILSGTSGMVSFHVRGDLRTTSCFIDALTLPTVAPSMGGVESLIEQPAMMSFYELSPEERAAIGIAENLVRFSVGLEDPEEIIEDLERALSVV